MKCRFDASVAGMNSRKYLALATMTTLGGVLIWSLLEQRNQSREMQAMQDTIASLQASLKEKASGLQNARPHSSERPAEAAHSTEHESSGVQSPAGNAGGSYQILKDLEADSANDPRSSAQKLQ